MSIMKRSFSALVVALAAAVGCSDSSGSGNGRLTVHLTDAPFPFSDVKSVDVFVVRIEAKVADVTPNEAEDETKRSGWVTLAEPNASFNLLDLSKGKVANLGTASLATGTYRGFRLVLDTDKSTVTLNSGAAVNIIWPSAAQTGIKINLDKPISVSSEGSVMILDFDVGRSFVMRGSSIAQNGLLFKPVLRATAQDITGTMTGSVKTDTPTGAGFVGATVEVLKAGTPITDADVANVVRSGVTDAAGNFRFAFLLPGSYSVRATPPAASGYKPAMVEGVAVTMGAEAVAPPIVVVK